MAEDTDNPQFNFRPLEVDIDDLRGKIIAKQKHGELEVVIRQGQGARVEEVKLKQLAQSALQALKLAQQISPDFPKESDIIYTSRPAIFSYMTIAMDASQTMIDDLPESQVAAILHEMTENLQEDPNFGNISHQHYLPELAEFLFTGPTRFGKYQGWNRDYYSGSEEDRQKVVFWGKIVALLLPGNRGTDPDKIFQKLLEKKSQLSEQEKIQILKDAFEAAKVPPIEALSKTAG